MKAKIPEHYLDDLSCYGEFVLDVNLLGKEVSDPDVLSCLNKVEDYYWFVVDGHFCFVNSKGEECHDVIIKGDFDCFNCGSLKSLKGSPRKVGGDFICINCSSLASLEGSPEEVGGEFDCSYCSSLTSLEGSPRKVGGDFYCINCPSLTSLEGSPKEVGGEFVCSLCNSLKSYEHDSRIKGEFIK